MIAHKWLRTGRGSGCRNCRSMRSPLSIFSRRCRIIRELGIPQVTSFVLHRAVLANICLNVLCIHLQVSKVVHIMGFLNLQVPKLFIL